MRLIFFALTLLSCQAVWAESSCITSPLTLNTSTWKKYDDVLNVVSINAKSSSILFKNGNLFYINSIGCQSIGEVGTLWIPGNFKDYRGERKINFLINKINFVLRFFNSDFTNSVSSELIVLDKTENKLNNSEVLFFKTKNELLTFSAEYYQFDDGILLKILFDMAL